MLEKKLNIWDKLKSPEPMLICITTNSVVVGQGKTRRAVMGAGVAKAAKLKFPGIDVNLAKWLDQHGNVPGRIYQIGVEQYIVSFPTKDHWKYPSKLELIKQSAFRLKAGWQKLGSQHTVYLPRPGCGLGGLQWNEVRKVISPYFEEANFIITHF